ncbi:MAG: class I SAM-dependent methyltransferase [bacterium]
MGKGVLEVACGTGQGLGYLKKLSKSIYSGDFSADTLNIAKDHYKDRIALTQFNAEKLPYRKHCFDVVILFEAIYYIPSAERFVAECRRVLRKNGMVLIATANKDLYDFNPSPHSHRYYGVVELEELFSKQGFSVECFGCTPVDGVSLRQRLLRPVKKLAVQYGLMPKTANGKKFLKKLVFGKLVTMPAEIEEGMVPYEPPVQLPLGRPDRRHKVIYCAAKRGE